jgi:23S rRNA (cytidine1920-2'-O)/16S rRNA (cytidine1409-2'-O)-methyltransferase
MSKTIARVMRSWQCGTSRPARSKNLQGYPSVTRRDKHRLDALLVERGLAPTRSVAAACVLAGRVYSGERRLDKPGTSLDIATPLSVRALPRYVSRGGVKLEGALAALALDVSGRVWLDIGASTGGFTDCLLQHGASRVYAVDVGRGQLAEKLRQDPQVVNRENTNARHLQPQDFPEPIGGVVVDASFIGLGKLLPAVARVLAPGGWLLAMIKPQFEAGRELAREHRGVIQDAALRTRIIEGVTAEVASHGFRVLGACDSSLPGPKGNLEHFVLAERAGEPLPPAEAIG